MIKEFVEKWNKYKSDLEDYFRNTKQIEYSTYEDIVELLFEKVINRDVDYGEFNVEKMIVIDDGDYQGTQIFILHRDTYQPSVEEYVYTNTYYGSCSGCDTLQAINSYSEELPSERQIKDYMSLALNLLQKCNYMEE